MAGFRRLLNPFGGSFVERWEPRIGERAARQQIRSIRISLFNGVVSFASLVTLAVVLAQTGSSRTAVWVVLWYLPVVVSLNFFIIWQRWRVARSMTTFLDIPVRIGTMPTFRDDLFEEWKRRHGLQ